MRVLVVGAVADFRSTRGQGQVLGVDGVRHIQRGEALGQELCQVEIDHWSMVLVDRLAAARDDQIGDENLHGLAVLVQGRRPHLDQPLIRARL